jgi:hypothetical protein
MIFMARIFGAPLMEPPGKQAQPGDEERAVSPVAQLLEAPEGPGHGPCSERASPNEQLQHDGRENAGHEIVEHDA